MRFRNSISINVILLCSLTAAAKDKKKILLTDDVLQARTVFVLADPAAGVDVNDPLSNRTARLDVEDAIRKWGRFKLATDPYYADLVIMVRKGDGRIAKQTIGGIPISNDPIPMRLPDGGTAADNPSMYPTPIGAPSGTQLGRGPTPQMEVGNPEDMISVYRGHRDTPTQSSPVWRYSAKDALRAPAVRGVEEFRRVIAEAEKQRVDKP